MKYTKKRKGFSRSRSDSGVSCGSTRSPTKLDKNVELVSEAHEANMDNVAEKLENEGESKNLEDSYVSVNGKLTSNNDPKHTSSTLAKQELFLSNLKMKTTVAAEALKIKIKPDSVLKKPESNKFISETTKMKKKDTSPVMRIGKCMIQNKDEWNKFMLGKSKPSKSKSKSNKRVKHSENCNTYVDSDLLKSSTVNFDAETNTTGTTNTNTKLNEELPHTEKCFGNSREKEDGNCSEISEKRKSNSKSDITTIHSPKTSETSKIQSKNISCTRTESKIDRIETRISTEKSINHTCMKTAEVSDQAINSSVNCSPKAKKCKILKLTKTPGSTSFNIDNIIEQVINNSVICVSNLKKDKNKKLIETTDTNIPNVEENDKTIEEISDPEINRLDNCSPKAKKCKIQKVINNPLICVSQSKQVKHKNKTTEITTSNIEDSEETPNQLINNSDINSPRSKKSGTKKSNKNVNKTVDNNNSNEQRIKKTKVKTSNSSDNLQLTQDVILSNEINSPMIGELPEAVEDFTNKDNSKQKPIICSKNKHRKRSIESDTKSTRKRKLSDTSKVETAENNTETIEEIHTKIKKLSKKSISDSNSINNAIIKNMVNELVCAETLDMTTNILEKSMLRIETRSRKSQNINNSVEENQINTLQSQENLDTSVNSDSDQMNNSFEIDSPKIKKNKYDNINCSEATMSVEDSESSTAEENLLVRVQKNKKSKKNKFKTLLKNNEEIEKINVTTELIDTGLENRDVVDSELELHQKDIIKEIRKKYAVLLNCNLNPFVCIEKLVLFSNGQWINKETESSTKNYSFTEEVQGQNFIKPDPENNDCNTSNLVTDEIVLDSIKIEETQPLRSPRQLQNIHSILNDFKREKQYKTIINLNRNWNSSKVKHRAKSSFKYMFTNDLISVTSQNDVFCGAQLTEGFSDINSPENSPLILEKITTNEIVDNTDHISNEEININLPISVNDSTQVESTSGVTKMEIMKITVKSPDKLNMENKRIQRHQSNEKVNAMSSEKLIKVKAVTEKFNKSVDKKINQLEGKKSEQIQLDKIKTSEKLHNKTTEISRSKSHELNVESLNNQNKINEESGKNKKLKDKFLNVETDDKLGQIEKFVICCISKETDIVSPGKKDAFLIAESNEERNKINDRNLVRCISKEKDIVSRSERKETFLNAEFNEKHNKIDKKIAVRSISKAKDIVTRPEKLEKIKTFEKSSQDSKNDGNNDLKEKNTKLDSHGKNKKLNKRHKQIKTAVSHKTEIESLSKIITNTIKDSKVQTESEKVNKKQEIVKSTEASNEAVSEQLSTNKNVPINEKHVSINIKHKEINAEHDSKDKHFDEMKDTVEISQDKIDSKKMYDETINTDYTTKEIIFSSNTFPKPKHIFKFVEKSDIKRPPSRLAGKVILNRPSLSTFKVPLSPVGQSIKSSPKTLDKDSNQTIKSESCFGGSSKKYEREYDSLSIYADTIGVDSIADAASVRNDSDSDNDFSEDLMNILPETESVKHTNVNEWVENAFKICEIQKQTKQDIELLDKLNELSTPKEIVPDKMSLIQEHEKSQNEISSNKISTSIDVNVDEKPLELVNHIEEVSVESQVSLTLSDKYQGVDIFRYMCKNIKCFGECHRKVTCQFKHEFPPEWKIELKNSPLEYILALYDNTKEKRFVFLFKKIFSVITEYLGDKRDFNNLIKMVKDVLEINMNSDRAPFINDIINALCQTGVTFHSIVEVVYKNANVNENLVNLLGDILLNLTVEKSDSNGNWPIIKELMQNRNYDIDSGIIQTIIIESLEKDVSRKDLLTKIYHDLIKNISNKKLSSIFESLLNNFYHRLLKYKLITEANEFLARCQPLNITFGNKSDHSCSPASPAVRSLAVKNVPKVGPFQNTPKCDSKLENVSPVLSTPTNINFVTPINRCFSQPRPSQNLGVATFLPPPPIALNSPLNLFNYPPPSFLPQRFTQPHPPNFNKKPVVNQKMPWYDPKVRNRQKPIFNPDNPGPSTSVVPFTVSPNQVTQKILLNKEEVKQAIYEENIAIILSLIMKYKDNDLTDVFIQSSIEAMLETNHNFPTFFGNLCQTASLLNTLEDKTLSYVLKTIGLNIILHLTQLSNWDQAYIVYKIARSNFHDDLLNVKLYLPEIYSYFKRNLIISLIHIKKNKYDFAWKTLRENAFQHQYNNLWQRENENLEISYRNSILDELLSSVTKKRLWRMGLHIVFYIIKNNISGVDVKKYINDILLHAINGKCKIPDIMEFVNCSPNWYNLISKHIFRSIVVHTVTLRCWPIVKNFYDIGCQFEIYPQVIGNERCLTFPISYVFEEIWLMLDTLFENMIRFRPITHNIVIRVSDDTTTVPVTDLPINLQQYQINTTTMQIRITNILNNFIKPAIPINKRNNLIVLSPEVINRHLEGRLEMNQV